MTLRIGIIEGAARDYAVVAHGDPPVIDEPATLSLRAQRSNLVPHSHEIAASLRSSQ